MLPDRKIGLVMALVIVGGVFGFLFRRPSDKKNGDREAVVAKLQNISEVDRQIESRERMPYFQSIEPEADPVSLSRNSTKPVAGNAETRTDRPVVRNENRGGENDLGQPGAIPSAARNETALREPIPEHNRAWEPTGPSPRSPRIGVEAANTSSGSTSSAGRTHVVHAGDTLTGIAAQYLGSSNRYREIYDANRDLMKSADDLREGMKIRIPDGTAGAASALPTVDSNKGGRNTEANRNAPTRDVTGRPVNANGNGLANKSSKASLESEGSTEAKIRFVPVKKGPFSAGRTGQTEEN